MANDLPGDPAVAPAERCVIIGAGPAGLTAAYELCKLGIPAVVLEGGDTVGGLSRTVNYKGYRFDIGGHRFFTKVDEVNAMWVEVLGEDLLTRPRLSRIFYANNFFDYPLKPLNALAGLGLIEATRIGLSYLKARAFPTTLERSFEDWVSNRFGHRFYKIFFKSYTEKVWGFPCAEISAEWAAQRIKNLDLLTAVKDALFRSAGRRNGSMVTTLIEEFNYPRLGPGMMWERCRDLLAAQGYATLLETRVTRLRHHGGRVRSLIVRDATGNEREELGTHFISSMPIRDVIHAFDPPPPREILDAADRLRYRDFLTVVLIVDRADVFPDNWIYVHSPDVRLGRIQNFKNWSPEMVPDPSKTALGLEYFVQENDELWNAPDEDLIVLGRRECSRIGLIRETEVIDGTVVRVQKAYPVYEGQYQAALATIRGFLDDFPNLQLVGRNGQHRYNNQDHSMLTAMYAARNIGGASHAVWDVNVDAEYHEEIRTPEQATGDRLVPRRVAGELDGGLRSASRRYDAVARGGALGARLAVGMLLAGAVLLARSGCGVQPQ